MRFPDTDGGVTGYFVEKENREEVGNGAGTGRKAHYMEQFKP